MLSQTVDASNWVEQSFFRKNPATIAVDRQELFTVQAIHNHQDDRIYAVNKEDVPLNEPIAYERQNLIVRAGVASTGEKTPLIFIEEW